MNKNKLVIHSGKQPFQLFFNKFDYVWADENNLKQQKLLPVFENGAFNSKYKNDYFVLDKTSSWLAAPELLIQLPDNQVIFDQAANLSSEIKKVLEIIGAFKLDFGENLTNLEHDINTYFFDNNVGYQVPIDNISLEQRILLRTKIMGYNYYEISCDFGDSWTYLGNLSTTVYLPQGTDEDIKVELQELDLAELKVVASCYATENHQLIKEITRSGTFLRDHHLKIAGLTEGVYFQLAFYAKGKGKVRLGTIHIHASRGQYGNNELASKALVDKSGLGGEVEYLFSAGDLKPPLAVMFAGHNTADVFEGQGMMKQIGCPHLLFTDSRYCGGGFYIGSDELEEKVVNIIKFYLVKLGFKPDELLVTGISMGAFASLYYGAQLNAGSIVAAKIIVNLGTVAANSQIKRPLDFNEANDIVLANEGSTAPAALAHMNRKMWDKFDECDLSDSDFTLGYMENEDYDNTGYAILRKYLRKNYPSAHMLAKGFWGRHNDNREVVNWFVLQVNNIVDYKYRQKFRPFDVI